MSLFYYKARTLSYIKLYFLKFTLLFYHLHLFSEIYNLNCLCFSLAEVKWHNRTGIPCYCDKVFSPWNNSSSSVIISVLRTIPESTCLRDLFLRKKFNFSSPGTLLQRYVFYKGNFL